jgi:hypothetical protein
MREAAQLTNERNEAANKDTGLIEMESVGGRRDVVRKSFVVPELPWMKGK